jgi:hypothetical protein
MSPDSSWGPVQTILFFPQKFDELAMQWFVQSASKNGSGESSIDEFETESSVSIK